jgi:hypothetical protein
MVNLNNKNRLTEDIVVYENFLTPEESAKIIEVLDKAANNATLTWTPISFYESYSSTLPKEGDAEIVESGLPSDIFVQIKAKIIEAVASVHDLDPSTIVEIGYHTQKWEPGAYARVHSDNTDEHGNTGPFARSRYAAFLYLNDDFSGGTLKFPKQDLEISPKVGMLAAFDGGFNNMHEVTLIESGVRYTIGSFWDDREEDAYSQEVRDKWAEEMKKIRESQEIEKKEWQDLLKDGYKLDLDGNPYKLNGDLND